MMLKLNKIPYGYHNLSFDYNGQTLNVDITVGKPSNIEKNIGRSSKKERPPIYFKFQYNDELISWRIPNQHIKNISTFIETSNADAVIGYLIDYYLKLKERQNKVNIIIEFLKQKCGIKTTKTYTMISTVDRYNNKISFSFRPGFYINTPINRLIVHLFNIFEIKPCVFKKKENYDLFRNEQTLKLDFGKDHEIKVDNDDINILAEAIRLL